MTVPPDRRQLLAGRALADLTPEEREAVLGGRGGDAHDGDEVLAFEMAAARLHIALLGGSDAVAGRADPAPPALVERLRALAAEFEGR